MSATQRAGRSTAAAAKTDPRPDAVTRRVEKSAAAFRTISEVADELDVPQHVLRFWESKFPQVRPLKRGGGRRYYRPEDVELLARIRQLLYEDGYTIKGVQRLMREGALKAKREASHSESAHAEPDEAAESEAAAEAAESKPKIALDGPARGKLESVLRELVALQEDLRRITG